MPPRNALWLSTALVLTGCSVENPLPDQSMPPHPGFASAVHATDPRMQAQFLSGFYAPEATFRWTGPRATLILKAPSARPVELTLKLYFPDSEIAALGPVTLSAVVNGIALPPQTFAAAGTQIYKQPLPESALRSPEARIELSTDKYLAAKSKGDRDLAFALATIGLLTPDANLRFAFE